MIWSRSAASQKGMKSQKGLLFLATVFEKLISVVTTYYQGQNIWNTQSQEKISSPQNLDQTTKETLVQPQRLDVGNVLVK